MYPSTSSKVEGKATEHKIFQKSMWTKPVNTLSERQFSSSCCCENKSHWKSTMQVRTVDLRSEGWLCTISLLTGCRTPNAIRNDVAGTIRTKQTGTLTLMSNDVPNVHIIIL
ncbi:hypothetical protein FGIG_09342 [Fasciola gigantica]|uniref:Uncharacterized protein n=1 Tax=Fasciola gigantica TaxID=46835 RepID=A0A504Y396_FASGI|nr:hypothetical protein FGIG_09342 [Fasciola gigantica]